MHALMQSIRKLPTPTGNRHGDRPSPRPTKSDIASMLEEEMDEIDEFKKTMFPA